MTRFTRHALTAVAALICGLAQAQSNVTISGGLDMGVYRDTSNKWNVGATQRSHWQLAGTEDLGDGLAATFVLRQRIDLDTGTLEGNGSKPFWHGESTIGLKGGFGAVRLGRALDAIQSQDWAFDPWSFYSRIASPAWDMWHWNYSADPRGGGSGRTANSVFYTSPEVMKTRLHVSYSPETVTGDVSRNRSAALLFNNGTIRALVGAGKNSAGASEETYGLRGNFDALSVMGLYNISRNVAGSKAKVTTLGASYALGKTTLKTGWGRAQVNDVTRQSMFSLGAAYALSKRTTLYVDGAAKRFPASDGKRTYGVGMMHSF